MTIVLSLLILLLISLFFTMRFGLNAAAAPLLSLSVVVVALALFGIADLLFVGGVVVAAFAAFCAVYVFFIKRYALRDIAKRFLRPGVVFFVAATVAFWIVLSAKDAHFRVWDEFSFWGTSCKLVFERNELYTLSVNSMRNHAYPPAIALLSYFVQFFSNTFSEWQVYLAYNMALMAVMSVLFARVKWKNPLAIAAVGAFSILGLYTFFWTLRGMYLYATSYSDFLANAVFAGILLMWFCCKDNKPVRYFATMAVVVFAVLIRDVNFALALIATGVIAVDMVITKDYPFKINAFSNKKRVFNLLFPLALMLMAVAGYMLWTLHYQAATNIERVTVGQFTDASLVDMLLGRDDYFNGILATMWRNATGAEDYLRVSSFGNLVQTALVLALAPLVPAALSLDKKRIVRIGSYMLLMAAGFVAFFFFYAYAYTANVRHNAIYETMDFVRYLSAYPMGWLLADAGILLFDIGRPKWKWARFLPAIVLLGGLIGLNFSQIEEKPEDYIIFSDKIKLEQNDHRKKYAGQRQRFGDVFLPDDRVYFASMGSDGSEWFLFDYEFTNVYTLKEIGGGNFASSPEQAAEIDYGVYVTRDSLRAYLVYNENADYLYLNQVSDYFAEEFGPMFEDELGMFYDGSVNFYKIHYDETTREMTFEPIWSAEQVAAYSAEKLAAREG